MCQMNIDISSQSEQTTIIYAVNEHGICYLLKDEISDELKVSSNHTEEKMIAEDISESILTLTNEKDSSLSMSNSDLIQSLSTQPFSIFDLHENMSSSLHLFDNNDISTPVLSPSPQLNAPIVSQYQNRSLIVNNHDLLKTKRKRKLRYLSRRITAFKKQLKVYIKKKKKKQQKQSTQHTTVVLVHHHQESQQIDSMPMEHSILNDFSLLPDLSKRKYIYKDITLANNINQNQMNWRIFQCTQQPSSISCVDQSIINDRNYHPLDFINNSIALPDIRVGLSRHHSIKQLHKSIVE